MQISKTRSVIPWSRVEESSIRIVKCPPLRALETRCAGLHFLVHMEAAAITLDAERLNTGELYILNLTESESDRPTCETI